MILGDFVMSIVVVATITPQDGKAAGIDRGGIRGGHAPRTAEPGCEQYALYSDELGDHSPSSGGRAREALDAHI
jgi:quinol monooxygenase YgiN